VAQCIRPIAVSEIRMATRDTDRHKVSCIFESGAEKRRKIQEKEVKTQELLSKTRRMTDFIQVGAASSATATVSDVENPEYKIDVAEPERNRGYADYTTADTRTETETGVSHLDTAAVTSSNSQSNLLNAVPVTDSSSQEENPREPHEPVNDIRMWPVVISTEFADFWIRNGTQQLQNCDDRLFEERSVKQKRIIKTMSSGDKKIYRKCSVNLFDREKKNGELVKRFWLCFSPTTGKLYCSACKLMSSSRSQLTHDGFCDWKHASARLAEHETSKDHIAAVVSVARRGKELGIIEHDMIRQLTEVENYWRQVLKRVVSVITLLCERGLAFRGDNETIGSANNGNYLGLLELVAEYDDFLKQHMEKHGNRGSGHTSYLSSTISEEFIELMGKRVLSEIVSRIKESRYYSISLDSTPDEGHIDQLTLVFRYMEKAFPVERFVQFMPNQGHKAQDMSDGLVTFFNEHGIDISNCRGQSFDNAAAMSGRYNGLQAKVAEKNNLASWIPCAS